MFYDVITIGIATRDAFIKSDGFSIIKDPKFKTGEGQCLALGSKIEIPEIIFTSGGGAINSAITFASQKLKTAAVCRIGDDPGGKAVLESLKNKNIDTNFIQIDKKFATAYSIILVAKGGERTILVYRGAGEHLSEKEIEWKNLYTKWFYLSSLAGNIKLLYKVIGRARQLKAKIAFNPGSKELKLGLKVLKPYLKNLDVLMMNSEEASYLTEISLKNEEEIFQRLIAEFPSSIIVMSRGAKGSMVFDGKLIYKAGIPKSAVIDRTGAGDAFNSGFIATLIQGKDFKEAIQFGTANATSVLQYFGAQKGILKKGSWGEWKRVKVILAAKSY